MKARLLPTVPIHHASQVLIALLGQISIFRYQNIRIVFPQSTPNFDLLTYVEFFGHSHTLACVFYRGSSRPAFESTVKKLRSDAAALDTRSTCGALVRPILVAHQLSPAEQAFCRSHDVDYFDLAGNARIHLGEIFIALQTSAGPGLPQRTPEEIWKLPPEFSERPIASAIQSVA